MTVKPLTEGVAQHLRFHDTLAAATGDGSGGGGGPSGGLASPGFTSPGFGSPGLRQRLRPTGPGGVAVGATPYGAGKRAYHVDDPLRFPAKRHVSCCKKVMEAVFGW